jgi:hypothetical protein
MCVGDQATWMIGAARALPLVLVFLAGTVPPSLAGPPYVTDDPEPTDTGHWENYLFVEGTHAGGHFSGPPVGVELNYGAFPDTQLSLSFPLNPNPGPAGMGVVWEPLGGGVKYRFIQEDDNGWRPQVAFFPQVFIPVGPANRGAPVTELFLHQHSTARREAKRSEAPSMRPIAMRRSFERRALRGGFDKS